MTIRISLALALLALVSRGMAGPAAVTVQVDSPGAPVSPTLWGIFFEDINCSVDGGLYAEMVRNRSFEDTDRPDHWSLVTIGAGRGELTISLEHPPGGEGLTNWNRHSLQLRVSEASSGNTVGAANAGYWGMALTQGVPYDLSFFARGDEKFQGPVTVELQKPDGVVCARAQATGLTGQWRQFKLALTPDTTEPKGRLVLSVASRGTVWFDVVSLFPRETWKGRGWRPDLVEKLAGLQPSFVRFPGGCWVEGDTMAYAYRWKDTIGDAARRRTHYNLWQYHATHGVGFHEYLQLCEDLGAEPLFVINCGMSHKETVPLDQMGPFVQDALDALEYCNGPVTSRWGALRAQNGHAAPFGLKYLEIGNENGGPDYAARWELFHRAIKAVAPEVQLVANVWGGYPTNRMPDLVDEHYYNSPEYFIQRAGQYDTYDRRGPKVYIGEYAVTQGCGEGNLRAAIGEAAFMTGIERNSDVVWMASYAPLFANVNYKKWNPDLICFDNRRSYGLPSYYVQQLFSRNRGDVVLPVTVQSPAASEGLPGGAIGVGTWMTRAEFKDMKVASGGRTLYAWEPAQGTKGWTLHGGSWRVEDGVLRQSSPDANVRAILSGRAFTNYTYSLKARKLDGAEGFLVLFNVTDEEAKSWWNIGGWGNDHHAIEMGGLISNETRGRVETNRWYDLRIDVAGKTVKCFLDGRLTSEGTVPEMRSLHASATRVNASGQVILKVVNTAAGPLETEIRLQGVSRITGKAEGIQLTSDRPADENSLDEPTMVVPRPIALPGDGPQFRHTFPGNSLTVLRIPAE